MAEDEPDPQALLTALTTEHFTLQSARTAMVSDANGRTSQFLSSVSGGLVALAFVAQVSQVGATFYAFALTVLPVTVFLGVVAVVTAAIAVRATGAPLALDVTVGLAVAAVALAMLLRFGIRIFTTAHVLGSTPVPSER